MSSNYNQKKFLDWTGLENYDTTLKDYIPVTFGYYNSSNNKFYSDSALTQEITAQTRRIYIDLTSNCSFTYSGTSYEKISKSIAVSTTTPTGQVTGDIWLKISS